MKCRYCGEENPDSEKICAACGTVLVYSIKETNMEHSEVKEPSTPSAIPLNAKNLKAQEEDEYREKKKENLSKGSHDFSKDGEDHATDAIASNKEKIQKSSPLMKEEPSQIQSRSKKPQDPFLQPKTHPKEKTKMSKTESSDYQGFYDELKEDGFFMEEKQTKASSLWIKLVVVLVIFAILLQLILR